MVEEEEGECQERASEKMREKSHAQLTQGVLKMR